MYSEILRIIEGGLSNDRRKIFSYSTRLASRFEKEGDLQMAKSIMAVLQSVTLKSATMDELRNLPVDSESRMQIVEVIPDNTTRTNVVLSPIVKEQLNDFISLIEQQSKLEGLGMNIPRTLLLYGSPGCGKTSIAHYISEQTRLPLVIARFDALVSSLLGSTAKNIRKVFEYAESAPCILFLDEFDAIAKARDDEHEMGELKRVINSLLQNIDAFPSSCVLIAATNHPELLDRAVWRRFQTIIEIGILSKDENKELIRDLVGQFNCDFIEDEKRLDIITDWMHGLSPSDIKTIINKVKVQSVIHGTMTITVDKVLIEIFKIKEKTSAIDSLVVFLYEHGISQTVIAEDTNLSLRQVKNILSKSKKTK